MAKYSSDSDSDRSSRYRRKHYRRSRSVSSSSSSSSSYRKKSKHAKLAKRRHRSRSRSRDKERPSRSYKSSRGSSRDRDSRRHYQSQKSKSSSPDREKKKIRSLSRDKSSSRSSSSQSNFKTVGGAEKPQNSATKDDFTIEPRIKDQSIIDEINSERFVPKHFSSSAHNKQTKSSNIVIDITADTIKIPAVVSIADSSNSIFHTSITSDYESRFDRWVKKLYSLRQKAIADLTHTSVT